MGSTIKGAAKHVAPFLGPVGSLIGGGPMGAIGTVAPLIGSGLKGLFSGGLGDVLMGSSQHVGDAPLMTPEQAAALQQLLGGGTGEAANQALMDLLQGPMGQHGTDLYKQAFVDPAMLAYEQDILPAIQQRYSDANAGSSSALNQALARSATDLSTMLGQQMGNFFLQQQQNQLGGLSALSSALGQRQFDPIIQQRQGVLGPLVSAGASIAGPAIGAAMSSETVKENIRAYDKGLADLKTIEVKQYRYKEGLDEPGKERVGIIAEEMPTELQADVLGVLGVDVYGLLALTINAVKQLTEKVEALELKLSA